MEECFCSLQQGMTPSSAHTSLHILCPSHGTASGTNNVATVHFILPGLSRNRLEREHILHRAHNSPRTWEGIRLLNFLMKL